MGLPDNDQKVLQVSRRDMGTADTLRYNVNFYVVEENYDRAIEELENYKSVTIDLPGYQEKIEPYLNHCIDLVHAIRAKRGFSKNISLTRSKQQEISETIRLHYDELQYAFKKIEQVRNQLTLEDIRSTVWFIKAAVYSVGAVILMLFITDVMYHGTFESLVVVVSKILEDLINWIFDLIKF